MDGVRTLGSLLNSQGEIEIEFSSVRAGRWAKKYAARMVTGLNSRTGEMVRRSIKDIVTEGVSNELSWQTIKGQLVTALEGNHAFSVRRCELIARTESAMAYNIGAVDAWQKSKVVEALLVYDGDYDAACREANGQTWTFDEAMFEPIEHPNCWREFFPILREDIHRFDKFNPYHDSRGRFTTHDGARSESFRDGRRYKVGDFTSHDEQVHNMRYIEHNGVTIGAPRTLDPSKQTFEIEDIISEIDALPKELREVTKAVHILDNPNPKDPYWAERYNMPNFRSFATGGDGRVVFYQNMGIEGNTHIKNQEYLRHTIYHEAAHNFDRSRNNLSSSPAWERANKEGSGGARNFVSGYSASSRSYVEDFADSIAAHGENKERFALEYPARYRFIEEFVYNNPTPRKEYDERIRASARRRGLL